MAITQAGSTLRLTPAGAGNTGTVSSTITVPADAEIAVVAISCASTIAGFFSGGTVTLTKGAAPVAMTNIAGGDSSTTAWMGGLWYLVLPDTGANKTLTWDWSGATGMDQAGLWNITFWKGIDTASPVRDGDGTQAANTPYTTPTLTAQTGDLIVAWAFGSCGAEGTIDSWSNLTLLGQVQWLSTTSGDAAWATGTPSGNTTVAASTDTNFTDGGILAVVLKPAAVTTTDGVGSAAGTATAAAVGSAISVMIPDADITDGGWLTDTGGTSLFAAIDETPASDTDYIVSSDTDTDTCEIRLSDPGVTLAMPVSLAYRYKRIGSDPISLNVQLMEGATEIGEWSYPSVTNDAFMLVDESLTDLELASITDFTNLRVRFTVVRASTAALTLEGDFSGDLTLEGDFSGSLLLEGS